MCKEEDNITFKEGCNEVARMMPKVECQTMMKEIELKKICLDIDIQLPREECHKEEKEDCKYEPKEDIIQQCEPTVKEVCQTETKNVCKDKCE